MRQNTNHQKGLMKAGLVYDKTKGYIEMIHCRNCAWFDRIYIPYGVTIEEYLPDKECERCHCIGVLY